MSTKTLVSLQEFMQLPDDGARYELDEGELIEMAFPKVRHSRVGKRFYDAINPYVQGRTIEGSPIGEVFSETAYHWTHSDGEDTVRAPDVSYIDYDRATKADPDGYFEGAPVLAIEVVSPSDTVQQLARKVAQYLVAGAALVWVAHPETREVHVFYPRPGHPSEREARILTEHETLTAPDLFPGWEGILVRQLFE